MTGVKRMYLYQGITDLEKFKQNLINWFSKPKFYYEVYGKVIISDSFEVTPDIIKGIIFETEKQVNFFRNKFGKIHFILLTKEKISESEELKIINNGKITQISQIIKLKYTDLSIQKVQIKRKIALHTLKNDSIKVTDNLDEYITLYKLQ